MVKGRRKKYSYSTENVNDSSLEGTLFSLESAVLSKTSLCMDNGTQIRVRNLPSNAKIKLYPVHMNDMVPIFKSESYYKHKKPVRVIVSRDKLQDMFNECEDEDEWETERCTEKPTNAVQKTEYQVYRTEQKFQNPFARKKLKKKASYPTKRKSRLSARKRSVTFRKPKHIIPRRKISACRFRAPQSRSTVRARPKKRQSRTRSRGRLVKHRSRSKSCRTKSPRPRRSPSYTTVKVKDTTVCEACGRYLDETCCEKKRNVQIQTKRKLTPPPRGRRLERRPTPMPRSCAPCSQPPSYPLPPMQPTRECGGDEYYAASPSLYNQCCTQCEVSSRIVLPCTCNAGYCKQNMSMRTSWSNEYAIIKPRECDFTCPRIPLCSTNQKSCIYDTKGCPLTDSLGFPMRDCAGRPILRFDCDGTPVNCYYDHGNSKGSYNMYRDSCSDCHLFTQYNERPTVCNGDNMYFTCNCNGDRCCEIDFSTKHKKSPFFDSVIKYFRRV